MQRFTNLKVWQEGHALVLDVYRITRRFPLDERYGLTSQLRRAIVSVPPNIAEGSKRRGNTEFARFLNVAEASLAEAEYLTMLGRDLQYISEGDATSLLRRMTETAQMLNGLRSRVEREARL